MNARNLVLLQIAATLILAPSARAQQWSTGKKVAVGVGAAAAAAGAGYLIYKSYKEGKKTEALQSQLDDTNEKLDELQAQERLREAARRAAEEQRLQDEQERHDAEADAARRRQEEQAAAARTRADQARAATYARAVADAKPVFSFESKLSTAKCFSTNPVSHKKTETTLSDCGFDENNPPETVYAPQAGHKMDADTVARFKALADEIAKNKDNPKYKFPKLPKLETDSSHSYCTSRKIERSSVNPAWTIASDSEVEPKKELCGFKVTKIEYKISDLQGLPICRAHVTYAVDSFSDSAEHYTDLSQCGIGYCRKDDCASGKNYKMIETAALVADRENYAHTDDDNVVSTSHRLVSDGVGGQACELVTIREARLQLPGRDELNQPFRYSVVKPEGNLQKCAIAADKSDSEPVVKAVLHDVAPTESATSNSKAELN